MSQTGSDAKTTRDYWDGIYRQAPRARLPSPLRAGTRNIQRLLGRYVRPGDSVLEIGCAPGKILAWVAARLGGRVAGIEYAPRGAEFCQQLFTALALPIDLRCEDVFTTSFAPGTFDVVYSIGVIEHFEDPRPLVRRHVELLKPGGRAVIQVPNYGGIHGRLQGRLDPENLAIHNVGIMQPDALRALAPQDLVSRAEAFHTGRVDLGLLSLNRVIPAPLAAAAMLVVDLLSALQPVDIPVVAPALALVLERAR